MVAGLFTFPDGEHVVQDLADGHPLLPGDGLAVLVVQVDAVHQLAVDVELLVEGGAVADADGGAAAVAGEVAGVVVLGFGNF